MKAKSTSLLLLFAGLLAGPSLTAQDDGSVASGIVGYKTVTIKGDNGLTLLGIEFLETPAYSGPFSSLGTNTMTVSGEDFDALLDENASYFVDVITGDNEGLNTSITDWSGDTLTLGDDLSVFAFSANDTVRVHRLPTIGDVFGDGGDVLEGGSVSSADLIFIPSGRGDLSICYYSNGGLVGQGWRVVGEGRTDQSSLPIYFSDGIYILKRSAGDSALTFSGNVKATTSSVVIEEGFVPYSTIFPSGTTLGNSGLFDPANLSESLTAGSASTADLVFADTTGNGELEIYYYSSGGLVGSGWRRIGGGTRDESDVELPSGVGILNRNDPVVVDRRPSF